MYEQIVFSGFGGQGIQSMSKMLARCAMAAGLQVSWMPAYGGAMRGGTIVGEHDIMFAGRDEVITLQHTAYSREIFAKGAVEAAKFLAGKPAGMYDMSDVIG